MRNEIFQDDEFDILECLLDDDTNILEDSYNPDERTELEKIKEHNKILRDYVVELENRNIILKEKILKLEREKKYYENKIENKGLI